MDVFKPDKSCRSASCLSPAATEPAPLADRPPVFSIALASAGALAYELLLMRLFLIIQWHHFGYMIISLALLGYGMSGTWVAIGQRWMANRYRRIYPASLCLFGIASLVCYLAAQSVPFSAQEALWHPPQALYLCLIFLLLSIPFVFIAGAVCLTLMIFRHRTGRIYGFDLAGAGAGGLAVMLLLYVVFPQTALAAVSSCGIVAGAMALWELRVRRRIPLCAGLTVLAAAIWLAQPLIHLEMSPYKALPQALQVKGTRIIDAYSSPLGLIQVTQNTIVPMRHAPGLSLLSEQEPLPQLGVYTDGGNLTVMTRKARHRAQLAYLDHLSSALPYHLGNPRRVLILGAGGGSDILQARYHEIPQIEAVELNPQMVELVQKTYRSYTGGLFEHPSTRVHVGDIRGYVRNSRKMYDLIQLSLIDGFNASAGGLYALNENYIYTVEAMVDYLERLNPGGYLCLSRWITIPPKDTLKIVATAASALRRTGAGGVRNRLLLIRSWQTSTLVVKKGDFSANELAAAARFCEDRAFDIAFSPAASAEQANRYNVLKQPIFYRATQALTGDGAASFMQRYKFDLRPATDDRPYFHHYFKWSSLAETWKLRHRGGIHLLASGYLILSVTGALALLLSGVFILLPLWVFNIGAAARHDTPAPTAALGYFCFVGIGFMFIEMALIQRFMQLLNHPVVTLCTCLTAFLLFAGLGSCVCRRLADVLTTPKAIQWAVVGITVICLIYLVALQDLFALLVGRSMVFKVAAAVLLIAPLAGLMGMPFPLALSAYGSGTRSLLPWFWGINGCASVVGASLAVLIAVQAGFTAVVLLAIALYLAAWRLSARMSKPSTAQQGPPPR